MNNKKQLNEVWLKAAILGATWAASEIILGSFLHNLRVPFKGNILTAIGIMLMVSASFKWKDKGLFWRTGLICALMKTMSPSAVIFGPMIAIFIESIVLEISVRVFGRNFIGFLVGSALAMSWILIQKIVNFIIFYGFNIVEVYTQLMKFSEQQLNVQFNLVWLPFIVLLLIYVLFGFVAAILGMKIGKNLNHKTTTSTKLESSKYAFDLSLPKTTNFPYSLIWLFINFSVIIAMLFLITKSPIYVWTTASILIVFIWTQRYKRGLRQLSKPKFWISFVIITMLTAFVITSVQTIKRSWFQGLIVGLQMNFRAAIVIVGFSVVGTELYNPKIRSFFAKTSFKQLPIALELAFETLPFVIGHIPSIKEIFKNPLYVIRLMLTQAEKRFQEIYNLQNRPIFIITGNVEQGKTTLLIQLITFLKTKNIAIGGFYSPRILKDTKTIGYDLVNIYTEKRIPFLRENKLKDSNSVGKFKVNKETLEIGEIWLNPKNLLDKNLIVIDEVGKWELNNKGWSKSLDFILKTTNTPILLVVREMFVEDILLKWKLQNVEIFNAKQNNFNFISTKIFKTIKSYSTSII